MQSTSSVSFRRRSYDRYNDYCTTAGARSGDGDMRMIADVDLSLDSNYISIDLPILVDSRDGTYSRGIGRQDCWLYVYGYRCRYLKDSQGERED